MDASLGFEVAKGRDALADFDDDNRVKRTGTLLTATAHIITAVIGSGVLSLAWSVAQLGWVVGPTVLIAFSLVTWYCARLLVDCYRFPNPTGGERNYTYRDAVRSYLGGGNNKLCGAAQYANFIGAAVGYTITTAVSIGAIKKSDCFHKNGHDSICEASTNTNMIIFASIQFILSQMPNFHKIWWLSIVAAIMSFAYSSIGLGLSIAKIAEGGHVRTTLTGVAVGVDVSASEKVWRAFQALGNIAFAFTYASVLIEIEDTLKSNPPENQVMKMASNISASITTVFYVLCGVLGYAAFGNDASGNFLTGFGFNEPFWLIDVGNICVAIHLVGAYQVFAQPVFQAVENGWHSRWTNKHFLTVEHVVSIPLLGDYPFSFFRLIWRTLYVITITVIAMIFPFFNEVVGLIGAISYWPLTVYLPIEMFIAQTKIVRFSAAWTWLKILSFGCLLVALVGICGSIQGLIQGVRSYKPFKYP